MQLWHTDRMPKAILRRDGMTVEIELTFDQLKELMGVNGTNHAVDPNQQNLFEVKESRRRRRVSAKRQIKQGDWNDFIRGISERAKKFLSIVRDHPNGISAESLAPALGFNTANQIGGLTGPGLVKIAEAYGFAASDLYSTVVSFPNGNRTRMFFPGKLLRDQGIEKPA